MYNTSPHCATKPFSNRFPRSFFPSALHLQIAAALVIRSVINCNIFLTLRRRECYRKWKIAGGRGRRRGGTKDEWDSGGKRGARLSQTESCGRRERGTARNPEALRRNCWHQYCKIMDFLLIIPLRLRFNYSPLELSIRLQIRPHREKLLHPIKQLDLLTLRLFSNHDVTFRVCQVQTIPALCAALLLRVLRCYTTLITVTL